MAYPMFTKKHFIAIAALLKQGGGMVNAEQMASYFTLINPQFDRNRFLQDATLVDLKGPAQGSKVG